MWNGCVAPLRFDDGRTLSGQAGGTKEPFGWRLLLIWQLGDLLDSLSKGGFPPSRFPARTSFYRSGTATTAPFHPAVPNGPITTLLLSPD